VLKIKNLLGKKYHLALMEGHGHNMLLQVLTRFGRLILTYQLNVLHQVLLIL